MHEGHYVFAQVMQHLPLTTFRRCVARYRGEYRVKHFSCLDQYLCLAFAQLTWRESLRDIEACLRAQSSKLYHLGFRSAIARNTLANANAVRDWRIYADFAQHLISIARQLYADDPLVLDLDETVYALDSTTIDLCLSVFPWAPFRSTKAAVKLHTLLDLRGSIPSFIFISDGKMHDVNILDQLVPEAGAFYVMDRGYLDFERLARLDDAGSFFVTRAKSNLKARRRKVCSFCLEHIDFIDYKDATRLRRYLSERGKILPRRMTGTCARHQRSLTVALKRARHIALLPFAEIR